MRVHNNTIRKYVQGLLSVLNDFEVQYISSSGEIINRKIPITYGQVEKQHMLDFVDQAYLEKGNYSVLPRSYIKLVSLSKVEDRMTNKLLKKNVQIFENHQEFVFNPIPWEFIFEYNFYCRGMNEACQIVEALQTKFNPTLDIDIWDQVNLEEPTRIPVKLLDIQIEDEGFTEQSTNIITISASLSINGNLYKPNDVDFLEQKYMEPCDDSEGITLNNTRVMPIIKQVGYSLRVSENPKEKITTDIARIEMFDVDENGHIICSKDDRYDYSKGFKEILKEALSILALTEGVDESEMTHEEYQEYLQAPMSALTKIKSIVFEQKSNLSSSTNTKNLYKVQKIESVVWGYDTPQLKAQNIKNLLT